uniref:Uncharacterized protein n=1 Tax=Paramoeba aestuarina TaxID=180227 RepID=A0A7S4UGY4_9EUKA
MKKQKTQTEDFVNTFQLLEAKLRKRLLYSPNYREVEQQYHSLLRQIRIYERDHHQGGRTETRLRYYSAFCSLSLAKCQRALKNTSGEACSLLSAGRQYLDEHFDTEERGTPNMEESYNIALQCFQLTCDIYLAAGKRQLAACVYIELATLLQAMGRTQEGSCFFLQAAGLQQEHSPLNAIDSLLASVSCCLTHRDYKECCDVLQQIVNLCFLAISPHRVTNSPSEPIMLSCYTNWIISSRITLILLKTLQRDFQGDDVGGIQNLFVQLAETGELSYRHDFAPEPEETVMLLQDFVKGSQLRNLELVRSILPSMSLFTSPLQGRILEMIVDDLALDEM